MSGWHNCMSRNAASAPDSHAAYMSSSVHASSGPVGTCCALFTSTSTPPKRSTAAATTASQSARIRTSPATTIASPPRSLDLADGARAGVGVALEHHDARTRLGQRERDAATDRPARAGDDARPSRRALLPTCGADYGATGTASCPVSQWRPAARRSSHLANAAGSVWPRSSGVGPISSAIGCSASTSKP